MNQLELLGTWLKTFPLWNGQTLEIDTLRPKPGSCAVFCQGVERSTLRQELLGGRLLSCRQTFLLRRVAVANADAAAWLMELQDWVAKQKGPALGQGDTLWSAQKGRLVKTDATGVGTYEVTLTATYEIYLEGDGA